MEGDEITKNQLNLWYSGVSIHNTVKNECCPDFSCCNREIKTPYLIREKFCKAIDENDIETINSMREKFLENKIQLDKRKGILE